MLIEKDLCTGCAACVNSCPRGCIEMQIDTEGFLYPIIDEKNCMHCGLCEKNCPITNTTFNETKEKPIAYAAACKDEKIRLSSSSGGIFSLLATHFIEKGGMVYGAALTEDNREVQHISASTIHELEPLCGSKYVQSSIGLSYQKVKKQLETGVPVLFSGTPCQVAGLDSFLGKKYDNLLLVDVICHGVPSAKVWGKYIDFQEKKAHASVRRTFFRHKKYGWKMYAVLLEFSNNTAYEQILRRDLFLQVFLQNVDIRPSCERCHFKTIERVSDITLGDFWGIKRVAPSMNDDLGTSLVIAHSEKGKEAINAINPQVNILEVDLLEAIQGNSAMTQPITPSKDRNAFFSELDYLPFDKLANKYAKPAFTFKGLIRDCAIKSGLYNKIFRQHVVK